MAWRLRSRGRPWGHRPAASKHAIEIYFYGSAEPLVIPLRGADRAGAESVLERLKSDVIDAQRHGRQHLRIELFGPGDDGLAVEPSDIQRIILVDIPASQEGRGRPPGG